MRVRLYNKKHPEGKLITNEEEYTKAIQEGEWFDAAWKAKGVIPNDLKGTYTEEDMLPLSMPRKAIDRTFIPSTKIKTGWIQDGEDAAEKSLVNKEELIARDVPKTEEAVKYCECGCGQVVKNRFVQGHSWRAKRGIKNGDVKNDKPPD